MQSRLTIPVSILLCFFSLLFHTGKAQNTIQIGYSLYLDKEYSRAQDSLDVAIKSYPDSARSFLIRSCIKAYMHNYDGAIDDCGKAIKLKPDYAEAYNERGKCKFSLNDADAVKDFNKAVELDSTYAEAYYNSGLAREKISDYMGAIHELNIAIRFKPNYADAFDHRAISEACLNNYTDAISDFNIAIKSDSVSIESTRNKGHSLFDDRKYFEALRDFNAANDLIGSYAEKYVDRGIVKEKMNDTLGALNDYTAALRISMSPHAYFRRGQIKDEIKDYKGAIDDYSFAIILLPYFADAYYKRGKIEISMGKEKDACEDLSNALQLGFSDAAILIKQYCNKGLQQH